MLTVAYYFLQVCLCSAVMMCYYALVLRNKRFHQYNRFYLLGVAILPWLVPLFKIEINKPVKAPTLPIQLFAVIADANSEFEKTVASKGFQLTWDTVAVLIYITISAVFFVTFLVALVKIYKLLKQSSCKRLDNVFLVLTQANGTPFSFFKFIFWNTEIDVTTHTGKQMLQHELTHVKEKHSVDKLLLQLVLIIGWFNPIFWLLKRELETIHEFIADNKTIANGDTATLATMLLTAAYPQQKFALTNPFFYSPIKRRIAMLTNNKNPKFSYARRLVVLPLLVAITLLFAFRKKEDKPVTISVASAIENVVGSLSNNNPVTGRFSANYNPIILNKTYTVVIDAGHGGTDFGALGIDGISTEKEIALSIAKLVKASNSNANINIVLTRDNDVYNSPPQKVEAANNANPDLFISLHCNLKESGKQLNENARENPNEGVEIFIANKQKAKDYDANYNLAGALSSSLIKQNRADKGILTRQKGIWVLQEVNCPSALIECGYMDNKDDLQKLKQADYQQQLATNILKGIEAYLGNIESVQKVGALKIIDLDTAGVSNKDLEKYDALVDKFNPNNGISVTDEEREWLFAIYTKMTPEQKEKANIIFTITPPIIKATPTKQQWNDWLTKDRNTVCIDNKLVTKNELEKHNRSEFSGYVDYDVLKKRVANISDLMNNIYLFTNTGFKNASKEYSRRKWIGTTTWGNRNRDKNDVKPKAVDTVPKMKGKFSGIIVEDNDTMKIEGTIDITKNNTNIINGLNGVIISSNDFTKYGIKFKKGDKVILNSISINEVHNYPVIIYNSKKITQKEFDLMDLSVHKITDIMVLKMLNDTGKNEIVFITEQL